LPSFFFCAFCIKRKSGQTQTESFTEDEEHPLRRCLPASATAAGVGGFTRCNGILDLVYKRKEKHRIIESKGCFRLKIFLASFVWSVVNGLATFCS
jgi:hypothetical protein